MTIREEILLVETVGKMDDNMRRMLELIESLTKRVSRLEERNNK